MARRPSQKNKTLIRNARSRHVTFSKRRLGIFKKASEICTLCAVEMALIIFSPGGKPYSFGHPSLEAVFNRLTGSPNPHARASADEERAHREAVLEELNKQYCDLNAQLKEGKKRGKELKRNMMNFPDIETMNRDELIQLKASLEALKVKVRNRKEELLTGEHVDLSLTLGGIYSAACASSGSAKIYRQTGANFSANANKGDDLSLSLSLLPSKV